MSPVPEQPSPDTDRWRAHAPGVRIVVPIVGLPLALLVVYTTTVVVRAFVENPEAARAMGDWSGLEVLSAPVLAYCLLLFLGRRIARATLPPLERLIAGGLALVMLSAILVLWTLRVSS